MRSQKFQKRDILRKIIENIGNGWVRMVDQNDKQQIPRNISYLALLIVLLLNDSISIQKA